MGMETGQKRPQELRMTETRNQAVSAAAALIGLARHALKQLLSPVRLWQSTNSKRQLCYNANCRTCANFMAHKTCPALLKDSALCFLGSGAASVLPLHIRKSCWGDSSTQDTNMLVKGARGDQTARLFPDSFCGWLKVSWLTDTFLFMNTRLTAGTAAEGYSKLWVLLPWEQKLKKNKSLYSEIVPPFYMVWARKSVCLPSLTNIKSWSLPYGFQRPRAEKSKLSICGHMRCWDFQGPLSPFAFHHRKDANFKK